MCGISGISSVRHTNLSLNKLESMIDAIAHRGPDGRNFWVNNSGVVGFGHCRLSIIDQHDNSSQPMHYMNRYSITYNGEIYNYLELKNMLIKKGYFFKTTSDTEVLLALYDLEKENCLKYINGMFSFAIWDEVESTMFCARDRFGEKPFYYHINNNSFYFASEMKAFWACGVEKKPNAKMLFLYLAYDVNEDTENPHHTFYENIFELESAHYIIVKENKIVAKKKYWDINLENKNNNISFDEAKIKLYDLLDNSVLVRTRAAVELGATLSGGIDSTILISILSSLNPQNKLKTFSARFLDYEKDEGAYMKQVCEYYNTESFDVFLTETDLESKIDDVFYYHEQPFSSTSIIADWKLKNFIKEQNIKLVLDGGGADEVFSGYNRFFKYYFSSLALSSIANFKTQSRQYENLYGEKHKFDFLFYIDTLFPNLRTIVRTFRNKLSPPPYFNQFNPRFLSDYKSYKNHGAHFNNLDDILYFTLFKSGFASELRASDRNSMACGVEVRLPFLDHRLVEFAFSLPNHFKIFNGWTKYILRCAYDNQIPKEICWRSEKIGFEPPNSKVVSSKRQKDSIELLCDYKILNGKKNISGREWEYYQASKLFQ